MTALDTVMSFLQGKGLTSAQAAGVAGNLQVESGFRADAVNPREGAVGIAQWENGRRAGLDSYAHATGGAEQDLTTQLNYLWTELQGSESTAYRKLIATSTPADAAAVFDQYYERSSGSSRAARVADAQAIAAGRPTSTGPATSSGGSTSGGLAVQPAGLLTPSAGDIQNMALKVAGGVVAGALVVVGLSQTMKGK